MAYVPADVLATPEIVTRPADVHGDAGQFVATDPSFALAALADPLFDAMAGEPVWLGAPLEEPDEGAPLAPLVPTIPAWAPGAVALGVLVAIVIAACLAGADR